MKITRRQLRKLISETRIRPAVPLIDDIEMYDNLDTLARHDNTKDSADVLAHSLDFPEDRSYSDDLHHYDMSGQIGRDVQKMRELGYEYGNAVHLDDEYRWKTQRDAIDKAKKICNQYEEEDNYMEMVVLFIETFTESANESSYPKIIYQLDDISWSMGYIGMPFR